MDSFLWFDFETFGTNPAKDRPSQFAAIRTDHDFKVIDEPINVFCKPADDFLPHPEACLVTGITPQQALAEGVEESAFFRQIHQQLSIPRTCAVGYNNIRFDDEVIRFGLYRNFYDAYAREWQDGNSRWDILDMLRMTHALRPEGIEWPINEHGNPSFRLELLSSANGISHENAHDALADVYATIEMAKMVKTQQPRLFQFLYELRDKRRVMAEIDLIENKPFVHCSGMLGPTHHYCGIMMPLVAHPTNKNSAICIDLSQTFEDLSDLSSEDFQRRIFIRQDDLPEGEERLAIKEVHYNKCPAVAPLGVFNDSVQQRLNIDLEECLQKAALIRENLPAIKGNLLAAYQSKKFESISNPDYALYSGGFFKPSDRQLMDEIRSLDWQALAEQDFDFHDPRLAEMLFRYRARNAPQSMTPQEQERWNIHKKACFYEESSGSTLLFDQLMAKLESLRQDPSNNQQILLDVEAYAKQLIESLN